MTQTNQPDPLSEMMAAIFHPEEFVRFQESINEPTMTLKEMEFSSRTYDYYRGLKLTLSDVRDSDEKRSWVRPSILEFIWLRTLERCRQFGLERDALLIIKEALFQTIDLGNLDTPQAHELMLAALKPMIIKHAGEAEFESYAKELRKEGVKFAFQMMGIELNLIELYLYLATKSKTNVGFILTEKKNFIPFLDYPFIPDKEKLSMYDDLFKGNFVFVNFKEFVPKILGIKSAPTELKSFITAPDANEAIKLAIEKLHADKMGLSFNYRKQKYFPFKKEKINPKTLSRLNHVIHEYPFADLTYKIRDGKVVDIERTIYTKE